MSRTASIVAVLVAGGAGSLSADLVTYNFQAINARNSGEIIGFLAPPEATATPEPSMHPMLVIGIFGISFAARRRWFLCPFW
jgi:hypothetical protein